MLTLSDMKMQLRYATQGYTVERKNEEKRQQQQQQTHSYLLRKVKLSKSGFYLWWLHNLFRRNLLHTIGTWILISQSCLYHLNSIKIYYFNDRFAREATVNSAI